MQSSPLKLLLKIFCLTFIASATLYCREKQPLPLHTKTPPSPKERSDIGRLIVSPALSVELNKKKSGRRHKKTKPLMYPSFIELFKMVSPSVVNISTTRVLKKRGPYYYLPFAEQDPFGLYERFFGTLPRDIIRRSLGSGIIWDKSGIIVTNDHVIENATKIKVKLINGKEYLATVIGRDTTSDIAVIKIPKLKYLKPVELGSSNKLQVGEWIVAIGNPFGLGHTITTGIVSAKGRQSLEDSGFFTYIQTNASINPGNSGGPLLTLKGKVVGINVSVMARGQGISFSIPIDMARPIVTEIIKRGKVERGWLGIYIQRLTMELAQSFGLPRPIGALVSGVVPDSPAAHSGIEAGDIIVEFAGKKVSEKDELPWMISRTRIGKKVKIVVLRNKVRMTFNVTLAQKPTSKDVKDGGVGAHTPKVLGMVVMEIPSWLEYAGGGVYVKEAAEGGLAYLAGIRSGDVILELNGEPVAELTDYHEMYNKLKEGQIARLRIRREDGTIYVALKTAPKKPAPPTD